MNLLPYTRAQMKRAIELGGLLPQTMNFWIDPSVYGGQAPRVQRLLDRHPADAQLLIPTFPGYERSPFPEHPEYRWGGRIEPGSGAIDAQLLLSSWEQLDGFLAQLPRPSFEPITRIARKAASEDSLGRYRLCHFWYFLYERLWSFRGMENALMDLCLYPNEVRRLFDALCAFYIGVIDRMHREIGCDGVYVTDDLGTQKALMFSPELFRQLFKPFYRQVADACHQRGLHFWLHTCGNVEAILDDLVEVGVDVLHPIQKFAMDEAAVAARYRGKLCIMCGMDVQHTMPFEGEADVRSEARRLTEVFGGTGGRLIFSMGNGVTPNIPIGNLEALYDEVYRLRSTT